MKQIMRLLLACAIGVVFTQATSAANSDPIGKNLFNPNRMHIHENGMYTFMPMDVEGETTYTFSMPRPNYIGAMQVTVHDGETTYIDQTTTQSSVCYDDFDRVTCSFTTNHDVASLWLEFESYDPSMFDLYIVHYGLMYFQLEIGETWTEYEPYEGTSVSEAPEFQGNGTLITSYTTTLSLEAIIGTHITAYDDIDGDVSDNIIALEDDYTGNETSVGVYDVLLEVSDSSGNTAQFLLTVHVIDDVPPIIEGPEHLVVDVEASPPLEAIIAEHFMFTDEVDGTLETYAIVDTDYEPHMRKLGLHTVTLAIEDASGNETQKSFTIEVVDIEAPEIAGPSNLAVMMSEPYATLDALIETHFTITDNHTETHTIDVLILSHDVPEAFASSGHYSMTIQATDASGNVSERTIAIEIYDDIPPIIEGPTVLEISYTTPMPLADMMAMLMVSDNDADLTPEDIIVKHDGYTDHATSPGVYAVEFSVHDGNNESRHTIYITVIDDVAPVFTVGERIVVEEGTVLSSQMLIDLLVSEEEIASRQPTRAEVERIRPLDTPGHYAYVVRLQNEEAHEWVETIYVEHLMIEPDGHTKPFVSVMIGISTTIIIVGVIWFIKRR